MSAGFTAGPWEYRGFPTPLGVVFDISQSAPGDVDVAYTYSHAGNARLIAAAPCLLAACQLFIEFDNDTNADDGIAMALVYEVISKAIRDAIAKATGGAA